MKDVKIVLFLTTLPNIKTGSNTFLSELTFRVDSASVILAGIREENAKALKFKNSYLKYWTESFRLVWKEMSSAYFTFVVFVLQKLENFIIHGPFKKLMSWNVSHRDFFALSSICTGLSPP